MKPTSVQYAHRSNVSDAQSVKMSIDEDSTVFLMDILSDIYSDPALAAIREYSSNAYDSHVEAGQTRPVEVSLPTANNKEFVVQDYGTGMSVDQLFKMSQYGYSTKRETNDQIGMIGIGSKSALAYAGMFTATSVKDGVMVQALFGYDQHGQGEMTVIDTTSTDKPNGVRISIPVSNVELFNNKAKNFFRWWKKGTILVDGQEPDFPDGGIKIDDETFVFPSGLGVEHDYIVMGNVAYLCNNKISNGVLPYDYRAVKILPIGSIRVAPSREHIREDRITDQKLASISQDVKRRIVGAAQKKVDEAKTHVEAFDIARSLTNIFRGAKVNFRGEDVPNGINMEGTMSDIYSTWSVGEITAQLSSLRIMVNYPNKSYTAVHAKKSSEYCKVNGIDMGRVFVPRGDEWRENVWLKDVKTLDWDDIKNIKLKPTVLVPAKKEKIVIYKVVNGQTTRESVDYDEFKPGKYIVVSPADISRTTYRSYSLHSLSTCLPDYTVVVLSKNRHDKFDRLFGKDAGGEVVKIDDAILLLSQAFDKELSQLSTKDLFHLDDNGRLGASKSLSAMASHRDLIDDRDLKELAGRGSADMERVKKISARLTSFYTAADSVGHGHVANKMSLSVREAQEEYINDIVVKYPLLRRISFSYDPKELVEYVNAIHYYNIHHHTNKKEEE